MKVIHHSFFSTNGSESFIRWKCYSSFLHFLIEINSVHWHICCCDIHVVFSWYFFKNLSIVLTIVFSCHKFVDECITSFYNFGNFIDLSFFYLLVKHFFVLAIVNFIRFFNIKLFRRWYLRESLSFFYINWSMHSFLYFWSFNKFFGLFKFSFGINTVEIDASECWMILIFRQ